MRKSSVRKIAVALAIVVVAFVSSIQVWADDIVYDNTATTTSGSYAPGGFYTFSYYAPGEQMGDEITLTGTSRFVTEFDLLLSSSVQTTLTSLSLSLYRIDRPEGEYGPGSLIWATTVYGQVVTGPTKVVFDVPNKEVPDAFIWVVGADSDSAGLATFDKPTVGSSGDYYWDRIPTDFDWGAYNFEGDPVANFGAKVIAVPEPTTTALAIVGVLAMGFRRRPARNKAG